MFDIVYRNLYSLTNQQVQLDVHESLKIIVFDSNLVFYELVFTHCITDFILSIRKTVGTGHLACSYDAAVTLTSYIRVPEFKSWLFSGFQPLANVYPEKQQLMAQVIVFLPPTCETQIEFTASSFCLARALTVQAFGE